MSFDPYDWPTNYWGRMGRNEANSILESKLAGTFLVRDSTSEEGDYVLSVRETDRVCHFLIKKVRAAEAEGGEKYLIGEQVFPDIASLLNFFKTHFLETTPLILPAPKTLELVIAKFDFIAKEGHDLDFKKGERLWIIRKDGEWWTAKNTNDKVGQIPGNYVQIVDEDALNCNRISAESYSGSGDSGSSLSRPASNSSGGGHTTPPVFESPTNSSCPTSDPTNHAASNGSAIQRKLPAWGVVIQERHPSAYDKKALRLKIGDRIWVTKAPVGGTWEGELNGRTGQFPFKYIQFVDS